VCVRGPLLYVEIKKDEDFEKYRGKLKGAIVIAQEPESLSPPRPSGFFGEGNRAMQTPPPLKGEPVPPSPFAAYDGSGAERSEFFNRRCGGCAARFEQAAWRC